MDEHSLFVHHAASGLVASDARWRSIGKNIISFEPCKRTEIFSVGTDEEYVLGTNQRFQGSKQEPHVHGIMIDGRDSRRGNPPSSPSTVHSSKAPRSKRNHAMIDDELHSRRPSKRHWSPPDKHLRVRLSNLRSEDRYTLCTPKPKRPRLASGGIFQVPFTGHRPVSCVLDESIVRCESSDIPDMTLSFLQTQAISSSGANKHSDHKIVIWE